MESVLSSALVAVPPSLTSQQLGTDTVVDAQRTTDTVKDVRSTGSGGGSPAAVSDGGDSNADSSPLVPLVNARRARRHGAPAAHPMTPVMAVPRGSGTGQIPHMRPGLDAVTARGRPQGSPHRPGKVGQGPARGPACRWWRQQVVAALAAASPGWPPAMGVIAAR